MGFIPLWVFLFLFWTTTVFRMGWDARGTHELDVFLAKLHKPRRDDDPPGGVRV